MNYLTQNFGDIPWIFIHWLEIIEKFCMSVSLFVLSLDLVSFEIILCSGVNFETSGLVDLVSTIDIGLTFHILTLNWNLDLELDILTELRAHVICLNRQMLCMARIPLPINNSLPEWSPVSDCILNI